MRERVIGIHWKAERLSDQHDPSAAALPEGYKYLREELRFEHTLLGARMTAYMTGQSFLFTAVAIAWGMNWHAS